jgi:hypothetical protein
LPQVRVSEGYYAGAALPADTVPWLRCAMQSKNPSCLKGELQGLQADTYAFSPMIRLASPRPGQLTLILFAHVP